MKGIDQMAPETGETNQAQRVGDGGRDESLRRTRERPDKSLSGHDVGLPWEHLLRQDPMDLVIEIGTRIGYDDELVVHVGGPANR
jgi:hypothetical protein